MSEARGVTQEELDAAKYLRDAVNLHVQASLAAGRDRPGYVAIRIADGKSPDGVLYDSREDANRAFRHETYVFFLAVGKDTMSEREALLNLQMYRRAFRAGHAIGRTDVIVPQLPELMSSFIPRTLKGLNPHGK